MFTMRSTVIPVLRKSVAVVHFVVSGALVVVGVGG